MEDWLFGKLSDEELFADMGIPPPAKPEGGGSGSWITNPYALTAIGVGVVGGGVAIWNRWKKGGKTPPTPPEPIISDRALIAGAIVVAVAGGAYVVSKLKGSWFNKSKK